MGDLSSGFRKGALHSGGGEGEKVSGILQSNNGIGGKGESFYRGRW